MSEERVNVLKLGQAGYLLAIIPPLFSLWANKQENPGGRRQIIPSEWRTRGTCWTWGRSRTDTLPPPPPPPPPPTVRVGLFSCPETSGLNGPCPRPSKPAPLLTCSKKRSRPIGGWHLSPRWVGFFPWGGSSPSSSSSPSCSSPSPWAQVVVGFSNQLIL